MKELKIDYVSDVRDHCVGRGKGGAKVFISRQAYGALKLLPTDTSQAF